MQLRTVAWRGAPDTALRLAGINHTHSNKQLKKNNKSVFTLRERFL
jgi:hypothetical protein